MYFQVPSDKVKGKHDYVLIDNVLKSSSVRGGLFYITMMIVEIFVFSFYFV